VGTIRLYDPKGWSFGWGSWIVKDGAPLQVAIESALIIYSYGFDWLGFRSAHFSVRQANLAVCRFHDRFGAQRTGVDCLDYHYEIDYYSVRTAFQRYKRFLSHPIQVFENEQKLTDNNYENKITI
jgi:RimJ/RimL family protein N-acetyltransferase